MPEETTRVDRAGNPKGNVYMRMRDDLGSLCENQMFTAMLPRRGQPAEAPWRLVLSSLNTVTKESAIAAMILGRPTPDPRLGAPVELSGRHAGSLFDLLGVGEALPSKRIAAEEPPTDPNQPSCRLSQHAPVGMKT